MSYIFELLMDIIVEGAGIAVFSRKIPMWIRIALTIVMLVFFGGISIGVVMLGIMMIARNQILVGIFMLLLGLWMIGGSIYRIKQQLQKKHHANENEF